MNKQVQDKIGRLQSLEQSLNQLVQQKQQFQSSFFELESAMTELKNTTKAFKIIGNVMIAADKEQMQKDVASRKEIIELKIASIEKQENKFREEAKSLQNEIVEAMKHE